MSEFIVVKAHPDLLLFVDYLQKKNAEALSFYPKAVFEREVENGRIFLGLLNGQPAGYLYVGARGSDVKCHQVCIEYDARRRSHGAALVLAMEDYAVGALSITLRCGFDLEANDFWKTMGYNCIAVQNGGIRRMRKINVWRKQLQPELLNDTILEPSKGKADASVWRRNKQTGLITQFARGKSMAKYREILLLKENNTLSGNDKKEVAE